MPILWEKKENISKFSLLKFLLHMLNINKNLFDIFTKKLNMQTYCKTSCFSWYNNLYVAWDSILTDTWLDPYLTNFITCLFRKYMGICIWQELLQHHFRYNKTS